MREKFKIGDIKKEGSELKIELSLLVQQPIEHVIMNLDPKDFGCVTPEEINWFEKSCYQVCEEIGAMINAKDAWFGDNGNEELEKSFEAGWGNHMKTNSKQPDYSDAFGFSYDWKAGWEAAKKYRELG